MKHKVEFKNFSPGRHVCELVEELIACLERHAPNFPEAGVFLRLFVDESVTRRLYHVTLTCEVPGRTLVAREERHDLEEAIRAAFVEVPAVFRNAVIEKYKNWRRRRSVFSSIFQKLLRLRQHSVMPSFGDKLPKIPARGLC